MWYENNVLIAIMAFTLISMTLLILSAVPGFNFSPGAEKVLELIVASIGAFVTGYITHAIQDARTTKSVTTTEKTSNDPSQIGISPEPLVDASPVTKTTK